ncbi:hypothetical protein OUZ56_017768 [Daphnia magna]|uniref:DUF6570 domain-containing protein n=1 Tax=Daphnia magna TaxID=35525 RepID=A0ABR0ATQ6_9CRUS|nr:hypothetical protein OUZ56_017768 [Daphnia magna]
MVWVRTFRSYACSIQLATVYILFVRQKWAGQHSVLVQKSKGYTEKAKIVRAGLDLAIAQFTRISHRRNCSATNQRKGDLRRRSRNQSVCNIAIATLVQAARDNAGQQTPSRLLNLPPSSIETPPAQSHQEEALPGLSSELPNQIISSGSLQSTTWREGQEDDLFQPGRSQLRHAVHTDFVVPMSHEASTNTSLGYILYHQQEISSNPTFPRLPEQIGHSDLQPLSMFLFSMGNPSFTENHPSPSSGAVQNPFFSTDANTQAAAWLNFPMQRLQTTQSGVAHVQSTFSPTFNTAPAFQGRSQSQQLATPRLSTNQPIPVNNQPFLFNLPVHSPLSSADVNARSGFSMFQLQTNQGAIAHIRPTTFTPFNTARALQGRPQMQVHPTKQLLNRRGRSAGPLHGMPLLSSERPCSRPNRPPASDKPARHPSIPINTNAQAEEWVRSPMFQPQIPHCTDAAHVRPPPPVSSSTAQTLQGLLQPLTHPTRQPSNLRTRSSALQHGIPLPYSGRSCFRPNQPSASCESGGHPLSPPDANVQAEAWLRSSMFQPQTTQRPDARRVRPAPPVTTRNAPSFQRYPAGPSHGMSMPSPGRPYSRLTQPPASKEPARHRLTPEDANAQANAWLRSPVFQTQTTQRPTAHVGPTLTALSKTELVSQGGEPQPYPFVAVQDAVPSDITGTSTSYASTSGPPTRRQPAQSYDESITSPAQDSMFGPPSIHSRLKRPEDHSPHLHRPLTSRGASLADIHETPIQQLKQFERDPVTALISLAINSGHNRFRTASRLYSNRNTLDLEDPDTLQILQTIAEEMEAGFTDDGQNPRARIVETFQHAVDLKAQLFGSASCGTEESALYHDVNLLQLPKLQLSPDEVGRLTSVPVDFRPTISHFRSTTGAYFHLHPEFVTAARDETGSVTSETAKLCAGCWYHLGNRQPTIPPLSIAAGIDFGVPSRIGRPPLHMAEQYVIARARLYASVIKLTGATSAQRHSARQGYVIAFPQPESAELVAEQARATGDIGEGSTPVPMACPLSSASPSSVSRRSGMLWCPTDVVFSWLRALKHLNHLYANITIDDTPEMEASLEHADDLIQHARIVSDDVGIAVDRLATAEREQPIAPMHGQEPEEDMELPQSAKLPSVFLGKSAHPTRDRGGPAVQVLQSRRDTLSSGPVPDERSDSNGGGVGEVGSVVDPETQSDVAEAEASAESHETARIDIPDVRGHRPMCEFEGNDRLLYSAFPFLFLLGSGLRKPGSVPQCDCRHMLLQFTCNFATWYRFLFCLFDQLQRHAATRAVTARFKNNPESLEKLQAWAADPAFL